MGRADALEAMIRGGEVHRDAVDASSEFAFTLLMAAAMSGARGACKRLVSLGADASATDARGRTALDLALEYGHDAVADLLARKGAPFGDPEKNKQTRADGAAEARDGERVGGAFGAARAGGRVSIRRDAARRRYRRGARSGVRNLRRGATGGSRRGTKARC
jgi:hypothetical protein